MSFLARFRKTVDPELVDALRRPQTEEDLAERPKEARHAYLVGTDLADADLRGADLESCDLREACLDGADLDRADLSWARLTGASLVGTRFGACRLVEADLSEADVTDADLSRVTGLTWASVRGVKGATRARWPAGFDHRPPRVAGELLHEPR